MLMHQRGRPINQIGLAELSSDSGQWLPPRFFFSVSLISSRFIYNVFITLSLMFSDPYLFIKVFDLDVQINIYPVFNKVEECSFSTVSNFFHWVGWRG